MTTESVVPAASPTRGSGLGGSIDDDDWITEGDGLLVDDDPDMHAAKTDATVVAAAIDPAMRARGAKRIRSSGEGADDREPVRVRTADPSRSLPSRERERPKGSG